MRMTLLAVVGWLCVAGGVHASEITTDLKIEKIAKARKYTLRLSVGGELAEWTVAVPDSLVGTVPVPSPPKPGPAPVPPDPSPIPPKPEPPKPPKPDVLPDGEFNISRDVLMWASAVDSPNRVEEAGKLAAGFESTASAIRAGGLRTSSQIAAALKVAIADAVPGDVASKWKASFRVPLQERLSKLWDAGRLDEVKSWAVLFEEIAVGLRAVK